MCWRNNEATTRRICCTVAFRVTRSFRNQNTPVWITTSLTQRLSRMVTDMVFLRKPGGTSLLSKGSIPSWSNPLEWFMRYDVSQVTIQLWWITSMEMRPYHFFFPVSFFVYLSSSFSWSVGVITIGKVVWKRKASAGFREEGGGGERQMMFEHPFSSIFPLAKRASLSFFFFLTARKPRVTNHASERASPWRRKRAFDSFLLEQPTRSRLPS